jgi:putative flippase GtrA
MSFNKRATNLPDIQKQLIKFFVIGVFASLVDLLFYYIMLQFIPVFEVDLNFVGTVFHPDNKDLSKTISFILGSLVTYNLNKYWTWKQKDRSHKRFVKFYTLYAFSLIINVFANKLALFILTENASFEWVPMKFLVAFVFATGTSAVFNFVGQKLWVFSSKNDNEELNDLGN